MEKISNIYLIKSWAEINRAGCIDELVASIKKFLPLEDCIWLGKDYIRPEAISSAFIAWKKHKNIKKAKQICAECSLNKRFSFPKK
jgi:hypothetical protein